MSAIATGVVAIAALWIGLNSHGWPRIPWLLGGLIWCAIFLWLLGRD